MDQSHTLGGRVAIVTGGSRGIGLAIAEAILARGGGSSSPACRRPTSTARASGSARTTRVEGVRADVRRADEAAKMVEAAVARFGGLDILVNNAGVGRFVHAADMTVAQWHDVIDTNLNGVFYCCHAAIPHLRTRGGGWIINVSSLAGKNAFVGGAAYCASKAGLNAFSEALMQEVRYDGIRRELRHAGVSGHGVRRAARRRALEAHVGRRRPGRCGPARARTGAACPSRVEIRPSQPPRK